MKKCVPPSGMSHWTAIWPEAPSATTALLARMVPARKLIALASGAGWPAGETRRSPPSDGWTTVRFTATDVAVDGIAQRPEIAKPRTVPATSAGPPEGPGVSRVSATRQGVTLKKLAGGGLMR